MYYCGFDLHAKSSAYFIVAARGRKIAEGQVPSTRHGFDEMLGRCEGEPVRVVLEASTRTRWAAQQLERLGAGRDRGGSAQGASDCRDEAQDRQDGRSDPGGPAADGRVAEAGVASAAVDARVARSGTPRWGLVRKRANLTLRARSLLSSVGINLGKRAFASQATWEYSSSRFQSWRTSTGR